jgi:hypothetical protein
MHQKLWLTHDIYLLLTAFLWIITACVPEKQTPIINPSATLTQRSTPTMGTILFTPTHTLVRIAGTPTITPYHTNTPTITLLPEQRSPTPTVTITSQQTLSVQPLSKLMLTWEDVFGPKGDPILSDDFKDRKIKVEDVSPELHSICRIECTKQIWASNSILYQYGDQYYNWQAVDKFYVVIAMFRSKDNQGAKNTAANLYKEFAPFSYEYGNEDDVLDWVDAPIENTKIGCREGSMDVVLTTAKGPIALWVGVSMYTDDGMRKVDIATNLINTQIRKLEQAGIMPE